MAEYQVTSWRELPSMVTARDDDGVAKVQLASRFQEAIDEAAMRLGETSSDEYMNGWQRSEWTVGDGDASTLVAEVAKKLEDEWSDAAITEFLNALNPSS